MIRFCGPHKGIAVQLHCRNGMNTVSRFILIARSFAPELHANVGQGCTADHRRPSNWAKTDRRREGTASLLSAGRYQIPASVRTLNLAHRRCRIAIPGPGEG